MLLKYYYDAGHGWLAVKREFLGRLNLLPEISGSSFQKGGTVYLEEDRDASLFLQKVRELGIEPKLAEVDHGSRSRIRSCARFLV